MATSSPSILNTNDSHNTLISINVAAHTPLKLTSTNYLSWKLQFHTLFIGYDLLGYINGSKPCPSATLTQNDTTRSNLAHTIWIRQDQLILNAIIGSISHTIIPFIAQAKTTHEAWTILATTYANVTSFLQSIKAKIDELALLGAPLDVEDLTDKILDGLASVITPKPNPLQFPTTANPMSRNPTPWRSPAPSGTNNHTWRPSNSHQNRSPSTQTNDQPTPQGNHPSWPYLGYCQICRIQRHTTKWCPSFQLVLVNTSTSLSALNKLSATPWKPRAHYASNTPNYTSWLLDNGTSHHVTIDLHNLSMHTPYNGSDDIMIGDGSGLSITHIGSSFLHTPHNTFKLNNVLYVLAMKKNLISISQIFTSNNVSIEFLPTAFLVKDIHTGATFLKDNIKDDIYEWPSAYYCLDPSTSKIYVSMHVRFVESVFPFRHLSAPSSCLPSDFISTWIPLPLRIPNLPLVPLLIPSSAMDAQQQSPSDASPPPDLPATSLPPPSHEPSHTNNPHHPSPHISPLEPQPQPTHTMIPRAKNNICKPITKMNLHTQ
ncbi:Retrovirus-related Pol polyprotein from transposon RE2 [Vitis vinifera]|uniref:Retrovirus-related Pol polyprotein from transposon RE2 n=1 Tax=Vitis vinifera TaxID=29760 RepID=A0A438BUC5_VITVI|nr:Retrovirus-related Pol polyprotein from transposon RE2 [Vitis vinifera]